MTITTAMKNSDPFAALAALRDSLPEGEAQTVTPADDAAPTGGTVRLFYERKGRGGKEATIIETELTDADTAALAATLKRRLGTGGSARAGEILLQGDRRSALRPLLTSLGFTVKG